MTASRTRRSRSESSGNGISVNLVTTSDVGEVAHECIEAQPTGGREVCSMIDHDCPSAVTPTVEITSVCGADRKPFQSPQSEVGLLDRDSGGGGRIAAPFRALVLVG